MSVRRDRRRAPSGAASVCSAGGSSRRSARSAAPSLRADSDAGPPSLRAGSGAGYADAPPWAEQRDATPRRLMSPSVCSGRSGVSGVSRSSSQHYAPSGRSARSAASIAVSGVGDLPPPTPFDIGGQSAKWQVPTKSVLGGDESYQSSDCTSVRTCTTIREFFDDERRWASGGSSMGGGRRMGDRPPLMPRNGPLSNRLSPAEVASVLPGLPPGKVPAVVPKNASLFSPHPVFG
eukprot:TRINITY_DN54867_c0_g1_i1.p1 TRINITY_DN54867_c0_g1~~TRINITY_DN54867_c0_g1_i1.p1  ORF type:complete len:234 (+),score=23.44 TRINITY_DN54867_c0_g1_i1:42-743(+)